MNIKAHFSFPFGPERTGQKPFGWNPIDPDGKKHVTKVADPAELGKAVKKGDWNEYHVIARGNHIILNINGVLMTEVTDNQKGKASKEGIFAFQLHPGPPMKVQFKDIRLKRLD